MTQGTIQNKDSFLNNVAKNLGRERRTGGVSRPEWQFQPQWNVLKGASQDELVDVLEKQCENIHTNLVRAERASLSEAISQVIHEYGGKTVMRSDDQRFQEFGLDADFDLYKEREIDVYNWDATNGEESIKIAERADVGITFSDITLAESGTVVLFSDNGKGRSVSLLPATYIAIIPKSTLVPRMSQATRDIHQRVEKGEAVASCVNFITGPSNSADIEMNLVVGVHGPIKVTYIVVEDA
jgi:L-lactate dehydrogenase complex protein LldG